MAQKSKLVPTTIVYTIGDDIEPTTYNELILKVADWYVESRPKIKEPTVAARQALECCLQGVKVTDPTQYWKGVETASFATRVRIACRFDVVKMEPLRTPSEKNRVRKQRESDRTKAKKARALDDPNIPDEIRRELKNNAKYGDDARVFLSSEEAKRWQELKESYISAFPELDSINASAELNALLDAMVINERHRFKLLQGEKVDPLDQKNVIDQIVAIKKALGIHPEQLAKRVQQQTSGTIGEFTRRVEEMPNYRELREKFFLEELLLLYQAYQMPSPRGDGGGYQIDDVAFFGATSCRTCHCANCGTKNVAGFKVTEIEAHLIAKGILEPIPEPELAPDAASTLEPIPPQDADAGTLAD